METTKVNIYNLETLQKRKKEITVSCKIKERDISRQIYYISDNLGSIMLRAFIGGGRKKNSAKSEIIGLLVSEGVETAIKIQKDPHNIKDKLAGFVKNAASGIINLLIG
ncbi:MAG: hypothetical protein ACLQQ4_06625 [Bacteroidia bacterium]